MRFSGFLSSSLPTTLTTRFALAAGLVVLLAGGTVTAVVMPTAGTSAGPTSTAGATRFLPGSSDYRDPAGARWAADTTCRGGVTSASTRRITGTSTPVLYQRQRVGVRSCRIPVATQGTYRVTLYLAETGGARRGQRVFDVLSRGVVRARAVDVVRNAGGAFRATRVSFDAPSERGAVTLTFRNRTGQAKVSAMRLTLAPAASPRATTTAGPTRTPAPSPSAQAARVQPTSTSAPFPTATPSSRPSAATRTTAAPSPRATPSYALDSSFDRPSRADPDGYRKNVDFNVRCDVGSVLGDDPIVYPNQPGRSHQHVFAGNDSTHAASTQDSLERGGSTCRLDRDRAAYWFPQLFDEHGTALVPTLVRAYYRVGTLGKVAPIPAGLRIIAGDARATSPQPKQIAGWQCRTVSPDRTAIGKQSTIPDCASEDLLEGSVVFPNCWDGVHLDSADHQSHLSYGKGDSCDSAHPVRLPQMTVAFRYPPGTTNSRSYLASETSGLTLHADFWNAWHQPTLDVLVDRCLNDGVHCGDVSPKHFPGPMP